jgi:acyl-CoA thioester hydrolase
LWSSPASATLADMVSARIELAVFWGDMDSLAHVNNAVYSRWLEQARIAYFERVGLLGDDGVGAILARQSIDFIAPLVYPDRVSVSVSATRVGTTSITLNYEVVSEAQNGAVVARGESVVVVFDYRAGKKTPISDELRQRIHGAVHVQKKP